MVLDDLKAAKRESDRRNYTGKHRIMRKLLDAHPDDFRVDSRSGCFWGLTHRGGFRMHLPRAVIPDAFRSRAEAAEADKTAALTPLSLSIGLSGGRPAARPSGRRLARVKVPAYDEPAAAELLHTMRLSRAARIARSRRQSLVVAAGEGKPKVANTFRLGDGPGELFAAVKHAMSRPAPRDAPDLDAAIDPRLPVSVEFLKAASGYLRDQTGLFTPSIPVDAFNNAVWSDVVGPRNPYGTRSAYGDNSQDLGTPYDVAAVASGVVAGAGAARDTSHVSPWDVATTAGIAAGKGYLGGLLLGKVVGVLAGASPETQQRMKDVGMWGGLLTGAVGAVFGE